ncbi:hypothetical protein BJX66DRAFT_302372 [Aspergillus keveii]|uniref:Protein kinase domain-containing protein n=1 Tax=Aspergillus keveii TaxID=714993 RepID=A0ABR4G847_9EURO
MESSTCFTLRDILRAKAEGIALGDRFKAALTLAKVLIYLQLASWLHKAIRSDNVVYFATSQERIDFKWPFLIGFDMSRPNTATEMTEIPAYALGFNLYRHPRVQGVPVDTSGGNSGQEKEGPHRAGTRGRFSALDDIYSFGIILLELGVGKCVGEICTRNNIQIERKRNSQLRGLRIGSSRKNSSAECRNGRTLPGSHKGLPDGEFRPGQTKLGEDILYGCRPPIGALQCMTFRQFAWHQPLGLFSLKKSCV